MTLPIDDRPSDELYPKVTEHLKHVREHVEALRPKLTKVIIDDMVLDLALSESVDEVGAVVEYLIQEKGIERPNFEVKDLMKNLRRVTELLTSLRLAEALQIPEHLQEQILKQETDRLWFDPSRPHPVTNVKLQHPVETKLPGDLSQTLQAITRLLQKSK